MSGKKNIRIQSLNLSFKNDCPLGCPCDSYDCEQDQKSVLVLSTIDSSNKPLLIKFDGKLDFKVVIDIL